MIELNNQLRWAQIELQEEIAEDRADVNRERIQTQREMAMRRG